MIGEKAATREVQAVLRHGGGTSAERARVAVGLIESRVRKAHPEVRDMFVLESRVVELITNHARRVYDIQDQLGVWAR